MHLSRPNFIHLILLVIAVVLQILLGILVKQMLTSARCWPIPVRMEQLVTTITVAMHAVVFMAGKDTIVPLTQTTVFRQMEASSA